MAVAPELVRLLRCPCPKHAEIEYKDRRNLILCKGCDLQFPVRDSIPVMLMEEATPQTRRGRSGEAKA